jgi:hypothetical protein
MMPSQGQELRGPSGRPLIALVLAVGSGILEYYAGSWLHLSGLTVSAIIIAAVWAAYLWYRAGKPK